MVKTKAQEKADVEAFFKKSNPFPNGKIDRRMARALRLKWKEY